MNRRVAIILMGVLAVLLVAGIMLYRKNSSLSTGNPNSREFKVPEDQIGRIFIADRNGVRIDLTKRKGQWYLANGYKADEAVMRTLLKTITQIEVINFVPKKGIEQVMKEIGAQGLKVEIFNTGNQKIRSYYVGAATHSGLQTFMVLDGSNIPYEVGIPGFDGSVRGAYWPLDLNDFISRVFAAYPPNTISSVRMEYPRNRNQSFILQVKGQGEYDIRPLFETTTPKTSPLRSGEVEAFLSSFDKITGAKVLTQDRLPTDSLISEIPFAHLSIVDTEQDTNKLVIYPVLASEKEKQRVDLNQKPFSYFVSTENGLFYSAQNRNLEKIFFGYDSFFK